ncbi:molybdopterin molybdotransferase MoeA [Terriglobus albidus]|uniref:molybdopterin molybdotransferase MoeA n=1 Tax=Terriglobus albidus TaxID=1592106 RepID=UPI001FE67780|nr:gephyrin-like molybdotransferase Glp [Terriglobus albidus]
MLTFTQALDLVLEHSRSFPAPAVESIPLEQALGRTLAAQLLADRDQPPFHRSTRDGYAVDAASFSRDRQAKVTGFLPAGKVWQGSAIAPGETVEIMTGAPVPPGADAVVMLEHVERSGDRISLSSDRTLRPGENVVPAGSEAVAGQSILPAGARLGSAEIGLAASVGGSRLWVYAQPSVAILATGDELVTVEETPLPHQIRNSNTHTLAALVREAGGIPSALPIAADTRDSLRDLLLQARSHDLVLLSGGVSAGKHDLVEEVLAELGAEFYFTGVSIQPGKPAVFGRLHNGPYFFGHPGNPVSTQVTFLLFAAPMLRALGGQSNLSPLFAQAAAAEPMTHKPGLTRFLPAHLESSLTPTVRLVPWQGSGDLAANARANCYAVLPADQERIPQGDPVTLLLR